MNILLEAIDLLRTVVGGLMRFIDTPLLAYFVLINSSYLLLMILALADIAAQRRRAAWTDHEASATSPLVPGVSLVVPAYNEEAGIVASIESLLSLRHPRHEVIVVDDGSSDGTFDALVERFDLVGVDREVPTDVPVRAAVLGLYVPNDGRTRLVVVRKANSGKTEAVNTGIKAATLPLIAVVDADSVLDPDALTAVTEPFVVDPIRTVATGGVVRPANGCTISSGRVVGVDLPRQWLARIQVVEYLRAFMLGRMGSSKLGGLILISGAFGVFRRDVLVEIGGYDVECIGEDIEVVMRIHKLYRSQRRDYRVTFLADPTCWSEVPVSPRVLARQRRRWHRGIWEALWKYRGMVARPRYGRLGFLVLPWFWLFELAAPMIELGGLAVVLLALALGIVDPGYAVLFLGVAYGYALVVSMAFIAVEEIVFHRYPGWRNLAICLAASILENFGYRQLTALWRCRGAWDGIRRAQPEWGTMTRTGFAAADQVAEPPLPPLPRTSTMPSAPALPTVSRRDEVA